MTHQQKMQLATASKVSLNTVRKWLLGGSITEANEAALLRAMSELGLELENETPVGAEPEAT